MWTTLAVGIICSLVGALAGYLLAKAGGRPPDLLVDRRFVEENGIQEKLNSEGWQLIYCDPSKRDAYLENGYEYIILKDKKRRKRTLAMHSELPLRRKFPTKEEEAEAKEKADAELEKAQQRHLWEHGWEPVDFSRLGR